MGVETERQTRREEMANKFGSGVLRSLSPYRGLALTQIASCSWRNRDRHSERGATFPPPSLFPWAGVDGWQGEGRRRVPGGESPPRRPNNPPRREQKKTNRRASFLAPLASASEAGGGGRGALVATWRGQRLTCYNTTLEKDVTNKMSYKWKLP